MSRPPATLAQRLVVLIGALNVPTLKRLEVGLGVDLATLAQGLSDLQAQGLITQQSGVYPLTEAGRAELACLLQQEALPPRRVLRYRPPLAVSA